MTTASVTVQPTIRSASPDNAQADAHTLAGEHYLLMRDVERRTGPVLALLAARAWPHAAGARTWLPDDQSPVRIDLDTLPDPEAVSLCLERLVRLEPGQSAEVRSQSEGKLRRVRRWIHDFDAARFGVERRSTGQDYSLRLACRSS